MVDTARFANDGFVVVPGVLDGARVEELRRHALEARAKAHDVGGGRVLFDPGADIPAFRALLTDPETLAIAGGLVGERVMDLHQSALHFGAVNRGWHKDCADYMQGRRDGPDWTEGYRIVHFAWYLQDHTTHGGGISFRRGSHRSRTDREGARIAPPLRAGDLVVFDLRTTHFGNTIQLRSGRHAIYLDPLWRLPARLGRSAASAVDPLVRAFPRVFLPEHGADRLVVFAMYGADDEHTKRLFSWMRTQPDLPHILRYEAPTALT